MTGELDLDKCLASLAPQMMRSEFVFCSIPDATYGDFVELRPVASFREAEGLTLVVDKTVADKSGLAYDAVFRGITLNVHSSLEAVGLTAAVAAKLAENGISANVIAAFFHDHIFVPSEKADRALSALKEWSI